MSPFEHKTKVLKFKHPFLKSMSHRAVINFEPFEPQTRPLPPTPRPHPNIDKKFLSMTKLVLLIPLFGDDNLFGKKYLNFITKSNIFSMYHLLSTVWNWRSNITAPNTLHHKSIQNTNSLKHCQQKTSDIIFHYMDTLAYPLMSNAMWPYTVSGH